MLTGIFRGRRSAAARRVAAQRGRAGWIPYRTDFLASDRDDPQRRALQHDGYCLDHGRASPSAGHDAAGHAGTPASDSRLLERSHATGRLIVEMVAADRRPSAILSKGSFRNTIVALAAIGARRTPSCTCCHRRTPRNRAALDDFNTIGEGVPCWSDLQPRRIS